MSPHAEVRTRRPDLAGVVRQRAVAAVQLARLAVHGGGLVPVTMILHVLAGAMPTVFIVGIGTALHALVAGAEGMTERLALAGAAFAGSQLLAPLQTAASQSVARRVDAFCTRRLMGDASARASLPDLERSDVSNELAAANEALADLALTPGTATEGALALIARYTQLVGGLVIVLLTLGPAGALAGLVVAMVNRFGQSMAFAHWGRLIRGFAPARRRMAYLRDLVTGTATAKEVRALGLMRWLDERYTAESRNYLHPLWEWRRRVYGAPFVVYALVGFIAAAVALLLLAHRPVSGADDIAALTMGLQGIVVCARFGVNFPESDVKMVYGRAAWESLVEFERLCSGGSSTGAGRSADHPVGDITLDHVRFRYPEGPLVLDDVTLTLPAGRSTAIVGVNGAGKTTLVKLLTALYRPTGGRISCDGREVTDDEARSWQRQFAVAFQDAVRYPMTLRENVAMGATWALDDATGIRADLDRAGLGRLVGSMPAGLDTPLSRLLPGGRDLSGGEWQRVALARSLFAVRHGARVLILDEPTAQLDARGEASFYDSFVDLTRGITTVVISHRFSSVRRADQIAVLDGGRITERGTHNELMAADGLYARMFTTQASRFVSAGEPT